MFLDELFGRNSYFMMGDDCVCLFLNFHGLICILGGELLFSE